MPGFRLVFEAAVRSSSRKTGEDFMSYTPMILYTAMMRVTMTWKTRTVAHGRFLCRTAFFSLTHSNAAYNATTRSRRNGNSLNPSVARLRCIRRVRNRHPIVDLQNKASGLTCQLVLTAIQCPLTVVHRIPYLHTHIHQTQRPP
jgi:hypothetical protein